MYQTRLQEIRKELEAEDPGKQWHKLAWELLETVESYIPLTDACDKLRVSVDKRHEYTQKIQELASEARRTGKSQSHRIPSPTVHDVGDRVDEILEALKEIKR